MALSLLDGTVAAVDFSIQPGTGTEASVKCFVSYISALIRRGTTQKITFCSGGWATPIPGFKSGFIHMDGFASTGSALSSPMLLIAVDTPLTFTFTADTGNTLTGQVVQTQESMGVRAFAEFARGLDFETYDAITSTWVIV